MSTVNPWLPASGPDPVQPVPVVAGPELRAAALARPQRGVRLPGGGLGRARVSDHFPLWWVGAHGGAGVDVLTRLVPGTSSAGRYWPAPDTGEAACVVVCRSNAAGLAAAQVAMTQWAAGAAPAGTRLVGLVISADTDRKQPKPLRELQARVAGGAPRVWHLPWVEAWREQIVPSLDAAPRSVISAVRDLVDLTTSLAVTAGDPTERNNR